MGLLDSNKVLPLEKKITINELSLSSVGNIGNPIDTTSYKEALIVATLSGGSDYSVKVQLGHWSYTPTIKVRSIYTPNTEQNSISSSGVYIADVSNGDKLQLYNSTAIEGAKLSVIVILRQKSYTNNLNDIITSLSNINTSLNTEQPKIVRLKSALVTCTDSNAKNVGTIDVSTYRFFEVKVRKVNSTGASNYSNTSFRVIPIWSFARAEGETATPGEINTDDVLNIQNAYVACSDWYEVYSPSLILQIKCTASTAPTSENPVYFHVEVIGIR